MAGRNYERLPIEKFGSHLLGSGDLDPIYLALHRLKLDTPSLGKFLMAYWTYYSAAVACYAADQDDDHFWLVMETAAKNETETPVGGRWPRGHERRHCRGQQALTCVADLKRQYHHQPGAMHLSIAGQATLNALAAGAMKDGGDRIPFKYVTEEAQKHCLFGPWIGFKIADMLERLQIARVSFDEAAVFMFKDPYKSALMLYRQRSGIPDNAVLKDEHGAIHHVVEYLTDHFNDYNAPPVYERPVGLQEVETILCKWKSHMNGHYPLNNDIMEIRHGLKDWLPVSALARAFYDAMPEGLTDVPAMRD